MHSDLELLRLERALQERADPCRDRQGTFAMACGDGLFGKPGLALQSFLVNDKAQGRVTVDDSALFPLAEEPTNVLARHIGQRSQVILANLVLDEQFVRRRRGLSKVLGKLKQGACDACLEGRRRLSLAPSCCGGVLALVCIGRIPQFSGTTSLSRAGTFPPL